MKLILVGNQICQYVPPKKAGKMPARPEQIRPICHANSPEGMQFRRLMGVPERKSITKIPFSDIALYVMQNEVGLIKVGRTVHPERRRREVQNASGMEVKLLAQMAKAGHREKEIHDLLSAHRCHGEYFRNCAEVRDTLNGIFGFALPFAH